MFDTSHIEIQHLRCSPTCVCMTEMIVPHHASCKSETSQQVFCENADLTLAAQSWSTSKITFVMVARHRVEVSANWSGNLTQMHEICVQVGMLILIQRDWTNRFRTTYDTCFFKSCAEHSCRVQNENGSYRKSASRSRLEQHLKRDLSLMVPCSRTAVTGQ